MRRIRVLVVDDAVVIRRLLVEEFSRDPALEVVGTAANGRIALAMMPQVAPDLVILDVEMPELDGLATLKELRKAYPRLPVVMFSALTERGAEATLDALALGASDYFTKPNLGGTSASLEVVRAQLVPKIKSLCARSHGFAEAPAALRQASATNVAAHRAPRRTGPFQAVAIGASTGGPNALADIFALLPSNLPVPILIVQHMPPMFTRLLAERLSAKSPIPVREAVSGQLVEPGRAWIAPGDYHMSVSRDNAQARLHVQQDPPENSCRPAVDVLFRSVARTYGSDSLAVILTGMGQDGLRGCEAIREAGGTILAQDEATSVVWGMPGYVARAGLADSVLALPTIAQEIVRRIQQNRPAF